MCGVEIHPSGLALGNTGFITFKPRDKSRLNYVWLCIPTIQPSDSLAGTLLAQHLIISQPDDMEYLIFHGSRRIVCQ